MVAPREGVAGPRAAAIRRLPGRDRCSTRRSSPRCSRGGARRPVRPERSPFATGARCADERSVSLPWPARAGARSLWRPVRAVGARPRRPGPRESAELCARDRANRHRAGTPRALWLGDRRAIGRPRRRLRDTGARRARRRGHAALHRGTQTRRGADSRHGRARPASLGHARDSHGTWPPSRREWPVAVQAAQSLREMRDAGFVVLQTQASRTDLAGRLARQMLWQASTTC